MLARKARKKTARKELSAAVADLEQALSLAPQEESIRKDLADTLEKLADSLAMKRRTEEAMTVVRRGLSLVPAHPGLLATKRAVELIGRIGLGAARDDPLGAASTAAADSLFDLESRSPDSDSVKRINRYLKKTDLKYQRVGDAEYSLPFRTDHHDLVVVRLQVVEDVVAIVAPIKLRSLDRTDVLYNFLRATYAADIHKVCGTGDGKLFLVAEVPTSVLDPGRLERLIRESSMMSSVSEERLMSTEKLVAHLRSVQLGLAVHLFERGRGTSPGKKTAAQLPRLCKKTMSGANPLTRNDFT
jgi:tetratricopeptide (TPR) repeat protein